VEADGIAAAVNGVDEQIDGSAEKANCGAGDLPAIRLRSTPHSQSNGATM
jgi:hypothetical protein